MAIQSLEQNNYSQLAEFFDYELSIAQEYLLLLFSKMNRIIGRTRLQKLCFLLEKQILDKPIFEYQAYKYGPFSSKLIAMMDELLELGLIREQINEINNPDTCVTEYEISNIGLERADTLISNLPLSEVARVEELIQNYGYKEMHLILETVYHEYPEYAENSIIKDQIFNYS